MQKNFVIQFAFDPGLPSPRGLSSGSTHPCGKCSLLPAPFIRRPPHPHVNVKALQLRYRVRTRHPALRVRHSANWPKPGGCRVACKLQGSRERRVDSAVDKQGGQLLTCGAVGTRKPEPAPSTEWGGPRLEAGNSTASAHPRGSGHGGR